MCIGKATRLATYIQEKEKEYHAIIQLGAISTTYDREGSISSFFQSRAEKTKKSCHKLTCISKKETPSKNDILKILRTYTGNISQTPPPFSAVKVKGTRAYKLARSGQHVNLPMRKVVISQIKLKDYSWPILDIHIRCGKGTYIRSLAHDIGKDLKVGGYIKDLERTRVGSCLIKNSIELSRLTPRNWKKYLLSISTQLPAKKCIIISDTMIKDIVHGRQILYSPKAQLNKHCFLFSKTHDFIAIADFDAEKKLLIPKKVFQTFKSMP